MFGEISHFDEANQDPGNKHLPSGQWLVLVRVVFETTIIPHMQCQLYLKITP